MTAVPIPPEQTSFTSPVIDYEPPPVGVTACPPPSPAALHRRSTRPSRRPSGGGAPGARGHEPQPPRGHEPLPPRAAIVFADAALRRVLEVVDRRRPIVQLRPLVAPALIDTVVAMTRSSHTAAATLRRVRMRMISDDAAEVFGTYTRGGRIRAIAARIELRCDRWRIVAVQIG